MSSHSNGQNLVTKNLDNLAVREAGKHSLILGGHVPSTAAGVRGVYRLPRAAITTYHKLGGLKQQKFVLSQFKKPEV